MIQRSLPEKLEPGETKYLTRDGRMAIIKHRSDALYYPLAGLIYPTSANKAPIQGCYWTEKGTRHLGECEAGHDLISEYIE